MRYEQAELPRQGWWRVIEQAGDNSSFSRDHCAYKRTFGSCWRILYKPVLITWCPMALKHQALNPEHWHGWHLLEIVLFTVCMWRIADVKIMWCKSWGQQFYSLLAGRKRDGQCQCTYSMSCYLCGWPFCISQKKGQWVYKKERNGDYSTLLVRL